MGIMVKRDTSGDSYKKLQEEGRLGKLQEEVYNWIKENPGCTQRECATKLKKEKITVGPRFAELFNRGMIDSCGKKSCSATNRKVMSWKVIPKRKIVFHICPTCKTLLRKETGGKK